MTLESQIVNQLDGRLFIAVPKKGRLNGETMQLLAGAGLKFTRKSRQDIALCHDDALPVAVVFLPAADIAAFVAHGNVDLGITGLDCVQETLAGELSGGCHLERVMDLEYGKCKLCVQVPITSDIINVGQLRGKRIVTSFENVTRKFMHDVLSDGQTSVTYVSGSVEAACSLGLADAVVDLVESGETMQAAGLHAIDTLVESQAVLIRNAQSAADDRKQKLLQVIEQRIRGYVVAQRHMLVKYNIPREQLKQVTKITPGQRAPTVSPLDAEGWVAVEAMIGKQGVATTLDQLHEAGATDILVFNINNCRA